MYTDVIGKVSGKVKNTVERGLVKRFAQSIGDPIPFLLTKNMEREVSMAQILRHLLFHVCLNQAQLKSYSSLRKV